MSDFEMHPIGTAKRLDIIDEMLKTLKPFAHPDMHKLLSGNNMGDESIVFQRNKAVLTIGDFRKVADIIKCLEGGL